MGLVYKTKKAQGIVLQSCSHVEHVPGRLTVADLAHRQRPHEMCSHPQGLFEVLFFLLVRCCLFAFLLTFIVICAGACYATAAEVPGAHA